MMKCPYCGAEIDDIALFCDNCGQAVDTVTNTKKNMDAFWQKENNVKQKDTVRQLEDFKEKYKPIQEIISRGKKLKSKNNFFRVMLLLFLICICVLIYAFYTFNEGTTELLLSLVIASLFTIVADLIFVASVILVLDDGPGSLLSVFIPIIGYFTLLHAIALGFCRLFVPLSKDEKAIVKNMRQQYKKLKILKKQEKNLKAGLDLIGKDVFDKESLKHLKRTNYIKISRINGWQIVTTIAIVVLATVFIASYYFAPMLLSIL